MVESKSEVYQGQFGEFVITAGDRLGVIIYRSGLTLAALSLTLATIWLGWLGPDTRVLNALTILFALFSLGLGISLLTIHIYLAPLHRLLQSFWLIGTISAVSFALNSQEPLGLYIYNHPLTLLGVGFSFAALTGIYFKEAFCFNRLEAKLLTPLVPLLFLGHLFSLTSPWLEQILLTLWTILFIIFVLRKLLQPIPPDIGDKSVFTYLKQQQSSHV